MDKTIYTSLASGVSLNEIILNHNEVDVIPAGIELSSLEIDIVNEVGREVVLKESLEDVKKSGYDYIFIDCPPSLGLLTLNALVTSTDVYIPLQVEFFALQGIARLLNTVDLVKKRLNSKLRVAGIILVMYDIRRNLSKEVEETIRNHFGKLVFKTIIRENVSLAESPGFGKSIFEYAPKSRGAEDYILLAKEITGAL